MMEMKTITETGRLVLRRYCKEDLQDLYEYLSDEAVVQFEPYKPMDMNEVKENLDWRISTDEMIAVELKSTHELIGNVYLGKLDCNALELGYVLTGSIGDRGMRRFQAECILLEGQRQQSDLERHLCIRHSERTDISEIRFLIETAAGVNSNRRAARGKGEKYGVSERKTEHSCTG